MSNKKFIPPSGKAEQDSGLNAVEHLPEAARSAFPTILEYKGIKVTESGEDKGKRFIRAISCNCKNWMCEECRKPKGIKIRLALLANHGLFKDPRLFSITVARTWFSSPLEAYRWVMEKKFISRLLTTKMQIHRWIWVLEVQEESGDGWPHWHILIDVSDLPGRWLNLATKELQVVEPLNKSGWHYIKHFFDLERAHYFLRRWKIGEQCKLSSRKDDFQSPEHAIKYITKYLIKPTKRGFPPWMLEHSGIRFYQPSMEIGSILSENNLKKKKENKNKTSSRSRRLPVERIAECKKKVMFMDYCESKGRYQLVMPIWGTKEMIPLFPGSATIEDFDFTKQKTFPICGFYDEDALQRFIQTCASPEMIELLKGKGEEKKAKLLSQWNSFVLPSKPKS